LTSKITELESDTLNERSAFIFCCAIKILYLKKMQAVASVGTAGWGAIFEVEQAEIF